MPAASGTGKGLEGIHRAGRLVHQPLLAPASHDDHGPLLGQEGVPVVDNVRLLGMALLPK
eukprot:12851023-Prorocentrum_lima.AAC.1